jgi:capsular exopolysaccharide synthesis family protein
VTSSVSGEGKTFFSDNLSLLYAYSGKSTILVAGDMRRPNIFKDFNVTNNKGLSNYLTGEFSTSEVIQGTDYDNLFIINSGPIPPNPSELLMRDSMHELMEQLKSQFEIIILDSPPIALVSDALILSDHVDHTVFIVRQNYTRSASLKALQEIRASNKIGDVSIVFNDVKFNRYSYGGYDNYGYYYGNGYHSYYETPKNKWKPANIFRGK